MARRRRSFFFDNISKRLLTNTTKNTRQSQDDANSNASANTDFMKQADVNRIIGTKSVNALADVVITNVANTEILQYDGTNWVNATQVTGFSGAYADLTGKPSLFSGSYNDLSNKPTIPTNNNQLTNGAGFATTSYVDAEVAGVVNSAPATLDTLNELAAALGDDANFATTTSTSLGNRLRIDVSNQSLTGTQKTNALTNLGITATVAELNYTDGVTSNIQTQLDAKGTSSFSGSYNDLTNKPTIPTNNNQLTNGAGFITSAFINDEGSAASLDLDNLTAASDEGYYSWGGTQPTNSPGWNYGGVLVLRDNNQNNQIAFGGSTSKMAIRRANSGTYGSWAEVWTTNNLTATNKSNYDTAYSWGNHASAGYSTFSGSYNDLTNKPTIPTNNNQLTNGAGYITSSSLSGYQPRTLQQSSRNLVFATGTTGSGGIFLEQSNGSPLIQLYSDGTNYGFLWGEWGGWDIKKADGGPLYIDISGTLREVYHTGNLTLGGGTPYLDLSTANYGTVAVDDDRGVGWAGYTIRDDWSLMSNGATTMGIYNDTDNEWALKCTRNGTTDLRYNGSVKLETDASGITVTGRLDCTSQTAYVARNYGHGMFGVYSATRYQHVWSMGTAYNLSADGTSVGDLYGISWTHTNIGTGTNQSISGLSHQMQIRGNGNLWAAVGYGIWTAGNVCAYSDIAVKENIVKIDNALDKVKQINGYTFDRIDTKEWNEEKGEDIPVRQAGVIAQEIEKVLPEVVNGDEGNKSVSYGNVVALLIEAIKEQQEQIEELKERLQ